VWHILGDFRGEIWGWCWVWHILGMFLKLIWGWFLGGADLWKYIEDGIWGWFWGIFMKVSWGLIWGWFWVGHICKSFLGTGLGLILGGNIWVEFKGDKLHEGTSQG
jgi:hypothetical protein